jgi:hypothetical protein
MPSPQNRLVPLAFATLVLGVAGYAYYRAQGQQAATVARLTALENCVIASNQRRASTANTLIATLSKAVGHNRRQAADVAVLRQAQQIQARTETLLDTLHYLRHHWPTARHGAALRRLPAQLTRYAAFSKRFVPEAAPLAAAPEGAGWLGAFGAATEPVARARLATLETQVRQLAELALTKQAVKVVYEFSYDQIGAAALPASVTVAPGAVYQAQLLLAGAWPSRLVRFYANGRAVPLDPATGQGWVQFQVPAARPGQPDTVRAEWHGRVQLPGAAGDTVLAITVPYSIVKPAHR